MAPNTPPRSVIPIELAQHAFFDQVCELFNDERALQRILVFREPQLFVDDELYGHGPPHTCFSGCGDGLVIGVGMQ